MPHVTVARFRVRPRLDPPLPRVRTFVPSDAAAYLSELHRSGARYTVLHTTPLGHAVGQGTAEGRRETTRDEEGSAGQVDGNDHDDSGTMRRMDG